VTISSENDTKPVALKTGLGVFSMRGFEEDENEQKDSENKEEKKTKIDYLPLVVTKNKGSTYNQQYSVSKLLIDNNVMFASNYPKPMLTFSHIHGEQM